MKKKTLRNNEGQDETSAGKHHDLNKPKDGQEPMTHLHIYIHAYMHTCIHAYIKLTFFFSGKFNMADLHEMGARYTVFCGSQELKPPRHEESKGRRSRQEGEPRLSDRTLGA